MARGREGGRGGATRYLGAASAATSSWLASAVADGGRARSSRRAWAWACRAPGSVAQCGVGRRRRSRSRLSRHGLLQGQKHLVRHDRSRAWRPGSGAVGLKQSVDAILGHVAPCPAHASRRAPSPRLHAPSLNLPFPTHGRSSTHPRPSSYIRIPHRHPAVGVVALLRFPFSVDFCEVPPLLSAFAHVPF